MILKKYRLYFKLLWNMLCLKKSRINDYLKKITDKEQRIAQYDHVVQTYYDFFVYSYLIGWGELFHFAPFKGEESVQQALENHEAFLLKTAGITENMRVLDIGCGIGGPTRNLAKWSQAHITGVNIHPLQIEIARKLTKENNLTHLCDFVIANATTMPFADETFDVVYSIEAICHIPLPQKKQCYSECFRILKPGGVFIGFDWAIARTPVAKEQQILEDICAGNAIPQLLTIAQIDEYIEEAGFTVSTCVNHAQQFTAAKKWWHPIEERVQRRKVPKSRPYNRLKALTSLFITGAKGLVAGGKSGIFTPCCLWIAQKEEH